VKLAGTVVWITGASAGIGEALAHEAAREGASLALSARRTGELERVAAALPPATRLLVVPGDVTDIAAIPDHVARIEAQLGPIDVLINNAGISQRSLVQDTSLDVYRRLMEIDFFAPVALTKAVLPRMRARRRGHVVVTSSVAGKFGTPLRSGYSAAKHALHGFFDCLRAEVSKDGIIVTLAIVGPVHTDVSVNAVTGDGTPHGIMDEIQAKGLAPRFAAAKIVRAIRRNASEVVVARGMALTALRLSRLSRPALNRIVALR